jgi:hypothetical protein
MGFGFGRLLVREEKHRSRPFMVLIVKFRLVCIEELLLL